MCVCVCDSFFLLSLFVTLYIFLHLTVMHSSTFGKGWVGMSACPSVVLACESLHVCTVCIWRCEHARFCVEVILCAIYTFSFFIHPAHCLTVSLCYTPSRQLRSSADTRMFRVSHVRTKRPLANAVFPAVLYSNEIRS